MTVVQTDNPTLLSVRTREDGKHVLSIRRNGERANAVLTDEQLAFLGRVAICRSIEQP